MMLPILISVSVAPSSYFFCASAPVADPARSANAATDAIAILLKKTVMNVLPLVQRLVVVSGTAFLVESSWITLQIEYHLGWLVTRKSPPQRVRGAASLVGF